MLLLALTLLTATPAVTPPDTILVQAEAALARGNPWRAYRLVFPRTRQPRSRTPENVWLAARAAAAWGGWAQVRGLLAREGWLDRRYDGGGRELLARAALALGDDAGAAIHAERAVREAATDSARGIRRVLLARALDRQGRLAEASTAYLAAASELPELEDWLRLRAATARDDLRGWASSIAVLRSPVALRRAPTALAVAQAGRKRWALARDAWFVAGDSVEALIYGVKAAATPDLRGRFLTAFIAARVDQLPRLIAAFDEGYAPLTPYEELAVARAASRSGDGGRALTGYRRAIAAGFGDDDDRYRYGSALFRAGRTAEAMPILEEVGGVSALRARAQYEVARGHLRLGRRDSSITLLRQLAAEFPAESTAGNALALAADLSVDAGSDSLARALWLQLAASQPINRFAPAARFHAAMVAYVRGDLRTAANEFDALGALPGPESNAGLYWAGRSYQALDDTARARERWRAIATRAPETYYAGLAGRRLGLVPWAPGGTPRPAVIGDAGRAFVRRVLLLEDCGLQQEANWEVEAWSTELVSAEELLDGARALAAVGRPPLAARLARRALAGGTSDSVTAYYLIYPVVHADVLGHEAESHGLDPAFSSGLIRQESTFDPEAVSAAGARGMMQVMPPVGRQLSQRLRWPVWDPVLLFQPDVSLELGHYHLANLFDRYRDPAQVLIAYNAGGGRIAAWRTRPGTDDPEVFIERIPYIETRDYVRIVLRNAEYYRRMYDWGCGGAEDVAVADRVEPTGVRVRSCG